MSVWVIQYLPKPYTLNRLIYNVLIVFFGLLINGLGFIIPKPPILLIISPMLVLLGVMALARRGLFPYIGHACLSA